MTFDWFSGSHMPFVCAGLRKEFFRLMPDAAHAASMRRKSCLLLDRWVRGEFCAC